MLNSFVGIGSCLVTVPKAPISGITRVSEPLPRWFLPFVFDLGKLADRERDQVRRMRDVVLPVERSRGALFSRLEKRAVGYRGEFRRNDDSLRQTVMPANGTGAKEE